MIDDGTRERVAQELFSAWYAGVSSERERVWAQCTGNQRQRWLDLADTAAKALHVSPEMCSCCAGTGRPISGLPCICDGEGTLEAEAHGLHILVLQKASRISELEAEVKKLDDVVRYSRGTSSDKT